MTYRNPQKGDIVARIVTPDKHGTIWGDEPDHKDKIHVEWHSPSRLQMVEVKDLQLVRAAADDGAET